MKRISILTIALIIGTLAFFTACEKDDFTEQDAIDLINDREDNTTLLEDSLANSETMLQDSIANSVYLSIQVVDATNDFVGSKSDKGLSGMDVTVSSGGQIDSAKTTATGMVFFEDLRRGSVAVQVAGANYTTVDLTANITNPGYYSIQVPVLSTSTGLTTVKGKVEIETDLTNGSREPAANVNVLARADLSSFFNNVQGISAISVSGFNSSATTDANGNYTFSIPGDANGDITYDIIIPEFETDQQILLDEYNGQVLESGNKLQTVTARFGTEGVSASSVPTVNGVYAEFTQPDYTYTSAVLEAVLHNNDEIESVNVTAQGAKYAANCRVYLINDNPEGNDAELRINPNATTGQIESITVWDGGYLFTSTPTIDLKANWESFNGEVAGVDVDGGITAITINTAGVYLTEDVNVSVSGASGGTGAALSVSSWVSNDFYDASDLLARGRGVNAFSIDSKGQDYAIGDAITISVKTTFTEATAEANMSTGEVHNVNVSSVGANYPANETFDVIFSSGNATAEALSDANGRIYQVNVTDAGTGYTSAPTAEVENSIEPELHEVVLGLNNDGELYFDYTDTQGVGYMTVPTATFFSEVSGELTGIEYEVEINDANYTVSFFDITEGGLNILGKNISTAAGNSSPTVEAAPGATIVKNIYLGSGARDF
jgi:hypothetical protein